VERVTGTGITGKLTGFKSAGKLPCSLLSAELHVISINQQHSWEWTDARMDNKESSHGLPGSKQPDPL